MAHSGFRLKAVLRTRAGSSTMARFKHPLHHVQVASPCKADWDQMIGDGRTRFCGQCNLNVYNLSGMTSDEAEGLITRTEGNLCVRFYRRRDGSIITQDCPIGLRAAHTRVSYWMKAIGAGTLTFLTAIGFQSLLANFHPFEPRWTVGSIREPVDVPVVSQFPDAPQVYMGKAVRAPRHPENQLLTHSKNEQR